MSDDETQKRLERWAAEANMKAVCHADGTITITWDLNTNE